MQVTAVGDEGGFAPDLASNDEDAIAIYRGGRRKSGIRSGHVISDIALDVAATEIL